MCLEVDAEEKASFRQERNRNATVWNQDEGFPSYLHIKRAEVGNHYVLHLRELIGIHDGGEGYITFLAYLRSDLGLTSLCLLYFPHLCPSEAQSPQKK